MNTLRKMLEAYRSLNQTGLKVSRLVEELQVWFMRHPSHGFLHPCVIDDRASLVCQAELSVLAPQAFSELQDIAVRHRIYLKEDQRRKQKDSVFNRRSNAAVVLGFCLGLISGPSVAVGRSEATSNAGSQVVSQLMVSSGHMAVQSRQLHGKRVISLRHAGPPSAEQVLEAYKHHKRQYKVDRFARTKIDAFLGNAYRRQSGDPPGVRQDLARIAAYYAQYPQVVELIEELNDRNIRLSYKKSNWQAQAVGSEYSVDWVVVYFDTRLAAQLWLEQGCKGNPACHVSPADALLHELLHAKLMIVDSEAFIRNGGMKPTLYLFDHEQAVIEQEKALYRAMSERDGLARPLRSRHSGELLHVSCALCLPGG